MKILYTELTADTLNAIVLEFVTRDGTDHTPVQRRVERVMRQLHEGRLELHFDDETNSCNLILAGSPS